MLRDYILFYVNGKSYSLKGEEIFQPLSTFLRETLGLTGTKIVCAEGDCGACTTLLGKLSNDLANRLNVSKSENIKPLSLQYSPVNSCIQYLYQLDCTHIVTIEGLRTQEQRQTGALNPVQEKMQAFHGAQCGYCTPGFIVSMCGLLENEGSTSGVSTSRPFSQDEVKEALTGNLCRCTGYEPILKACTTLTSSQWPLLESQYPEKEMISAFQTLQTQPIQIEAGGRVYVNPLEIKEAVGLKKAHPGITLVAGGTDVSVVCNKKGFSPTHLMSLSRLKALNTLKIEENKLCIGAKATLTEIEQFIQPYFPEFQNILAVYGSPQIKNAGTLAGNIATGSPIGDSIPFLMVMEASVEVVGTDGYRRIPINAFYTGYRQMVLKPDEIITTIQIPLLQQGEHLKLYKLSKRKHLDISGVAAGFFIRLNPSKTIETIRIAYGGVGPTVVRLLKTEAYLKDQPIALEVFKEAGVIAQSEISPLSDVRGSQAYRLLLARNLPVKLFYDLPAEVWEKNP